MWPTERTFEEPRAWARERRHTAERDTTVNRLLKVALIVGYGALGCAVFVAHVNPASGYELSIYSSTPPLFWALWAVVVAAGVGASVYAPRTNLGLAGLVLGGLGAFAVPALPLLRGYYFLGVHDALTHLGLVRGVSTGATSPWDLVYPVSHTMAVVLGELGGTGAPVAMLRTELVFVALYFVGVPMVVGELVDDRRALIVAGFSAFLLLPINTISTYLVFHPFSMAVLSFPLVLYAAVSHITGRFDDALVGPITVSGALLVVTGVGFVLTHPQASLNFVILLTAIAVTQSVATRRWEDSPVADTRPVHAYVAVIVVVFFAWNTQHWQLFASVQNTLDALWATVGGQSQAGEVVVDQSTQAKQDQVGYSLPELFGKLFLVETVFCLLAVGIVGRYLRARRNAETGRYPDCEAAITYLTIGGLAVLPFFALQFLGAVSAYFFRHIGFGMVLVTVLGSVGLYSFLTAPPRALRPDRLRPVVAVVVIVLLALSMVTVFNSPFIHKPTMHADEQQMAGWETSFAEQPPSIAEGESGRVWYGTVRTPMVRYKQALAHKPGTSWYPGFVTPFPIPSGPLTDTQIEGGLVEHYRNHPEEVAQRDHYVPVSTMARQRAIGAYHGLHFQRETFDSLETQSGVHRVHSNGQYVVHYVDLPEWRAFDDE